MPWPPGTSYGPPPNLWISANAGPPVEHDPKCCGIHPGKSPTSLTHAKSTRNFSLCEQLAHTSSKIIHPVHASTWFKYVSTLFQLISSFCATCLDQTWSLFETSISTRVSLALFYSNDSCQTQRVPLVQVSQWLSSSCSASRPSSCFTSNQMV